MKGAVNQFWFYFLDILYGLFFSLNAILTAYVAAFTGRNWESTDPTERSLIIAAMLVNWSGTMMAFFRTIRRRLSDGKPLIDDTDQITKP